MQVADLEAERARLATLLSRPSRGAPDTQALEAERQRSAQLQADLDEARRALAAGRAERERWMTEMTEQARSGDDAPDAPAAFISDSRARRSVPAQSRLRRVHPARASRSASRVEPAAGRRAGARVRPRRRAGAQGPRADGPRARGLRRRRRGRDRRRPAIARGGAAG